MKKIKAVFLFCTFFLAVGAFAAQSQTDQAQPQSGQEGKGYHEHGKARKAGADMDQLMKELTAKLNLSADQQTKMRAIMAEGHEQGRAIMNDTSLSQEEKHSKMQAAHDAMHAKAREVLTDDQKPKFDQIVQEKMKEHENQAGHEHQKGEHNPK